MAIKLGTENKNKTYAAIGLGIIGLLGAAYEINDQFFSNPAQPAAVSAPPPASVKQPAAAGRTASVPASAEAAPGIFAHQAIALPGASALDPTLHPEVMAQAEDTTYNGDGRNIFSANSAPAPTPSIPKPIGPARPQPVIPQGPPPPPPPPNIDLKFYAYWAPHGGGKKRVCLMHGEDIFIASEGDVVDRRYKVVKIEAFSVDVEDLAYNHTQTLPLTQN
jgi:hypothetical protein